MIGQVRKIRFYKGWIKKLAKFESRVWEVRKVWKLVKFDKFEKFETFQNLENLLAKFEKFDISNSRSLQTKRDESARENAEATKTPQPKARAPKPPQPNRTRIPPPPHLTIVISTAVKIHTSICNRYLI